MKRTVYSLIALLFTMLLGLSCAQTGPEGPEGDEAWLMLSVEEDPLPVVQITRGGTPTVYKIRVTDSGDNVVYSCDDHTTLTEPVALKTGRYTVTAFNCDEPEASFDSHYYYASETVDMVGGQQQNVNLLCSLGGVLVSAVFDDTLKEKFPTYSVEVTNCEPDVPGTPLSFDCDNEGAEGYLKCSGTITYCVTLTNSQGSEFQIKTTLRDGISANQHYIFRFRYGEGDPDEIVDESMSQHEYLVNIGLGLDKAAPTIVERNGADLSQPVLVVTGGAPAFELVVDAPAEINAMTITHDSDALAAKGLPRSFKPITLDGVALAAINGLGLTWNSFEHEAQAVLDFSDLLETLSDPLSGLGEGEYTFTVWVEDHHGQTAEQTVVFEVSQVQPDVATVAIPAPQKEYVWAKFATLFGRWLNDPQPAGIGFKYRKVGETAWTTTAGTPVPDGSKGFSLRVSGLEPNTQYEYMAVSDITSRTTAQRFTTDGATPLYNLSFEEWHQATPNNAWYPNPNTTESTWVWDSGNKGANTLSAVNPTSKETSIVVSGAAVKMETKVVNAIIMKVLAAGNIYSGKFGAVQGTSGATLDFGRPYTYRPTSMSGYYRYEPVTVNNGSHAGMSGQQDQCSIYIALMAERSGPFVVNTSTSTFLNLNGDDGTKNPGSGMNSDGVIALGELPIEACGPTTGSEANGYKKFTINLTYYDKTKTPTHVVVVASASRYGDYFTGGEGSKLYVDEFSFGFDPVD